MATTWLEESTEVLRILINDFGDTPDYQDNTLEQLLIVAAKYIIKEVQLGTTYTVTFSTGDVSPDPSSDADFMNFVVLKASCLINNWKFDDLAVIQGIRANLGPASMQVDTSTNVLLALLQEGPCKAYEELKQQHNFGRVGVVRGIFGPFVSNKYWPENNVFGRTY